MDSVRKVLFATLKRRHLAESDPVKRASSYVRMRSAALRILLLCVLSNHGCSKDGTTEPKKPAGRPGDMPEGRSARRARPWTTQATFSDFTPDAIGGGNTLRLSISTRLPERPIKSVDGFLTLTDSKGQEVYGQEIQLSNIVGKSEFAAKTLRIQYDETNPGHRSMRHDRKLTAAFTPTKIIYADGTEKELLSHAESR